MKLGQYQSKLEYLVLAGKEMLESDETFNTDGDWNFEDDGKLSASVARQGQQQGTSEDRSIAMPKAIASLSGDHITVDSVLSEVFSFCQKPATSCKVRESSTSLSNQQLLEYLMTWKLFSGRATSGVQILIQRFSLDKAPRSLSRAAESHPLLEQNLTLTGRESPSNHRVGSLL